MEQEKFLCSVCGGSFSLYLSFKKHVESKHPLNVVELEEGGEQSGVFWCHLCGQEFLFKRELRRHMRLKPNCIASQQDHNYMDLPIKEEPSDDLDFSCGGCGGVFSTLFNLRKHCRAKHPALLDTLAPRKKIGKFICDECGRRFSHRKSLGRHKISKHKSFPDLKECGECGKPFLNLVNFHKHMKSKHPESTTTLVLKGIKDGEFECDTCGKVFSQRKNLRRHVLDKHQEASAYYTGKSVAVYQCPLCSFNKSGDVSLIMNHFAEEHGIIVSSDSREFNSREAFLKWKENFEKTTKSSYIKKAHVGSTSYYRCHRSGKYRPRGRGIRNLKVQGTNKIGGFCPAGMQVKIVGERYLVKYSKTHVGHTNDLKHLSLSAREKQTLASEIAAQVSLDEILSNLRKSAGPTENDLERVDLVTKQDLANIVRQYQLGETAIKHSAAAGSLDSWLLKSWHNILYYKPQNCIDPENPELGEQHFILIIMTQTQKDALIRFGGGCICLDKTDVSGNRLNLCTVFVVNGLRCGFPVALLISSSQERQILEFFYSAIKKAVGEVTPGLLLTDVVEDYHSAWLSVMGEPGQTLFCLWQVDEDWKENFERMVPDSVGTEALYQLRAVMREKKSELFNYALAQVCNKLRTEYCITEFARYFVENYSENTQYWSTAYRPIDALKVDADLERLHLSMRYLYSESRRTPKLFKTIDSILQFIDVTLFERAADIDKNRNKKIQNISSNHKASTYLNIKSIVEVSSSWYICETFKRNCEFRVDEANPDCSCEIRCVECNVCIHKYVCTCSESVLKRNMCKHIHLLCRYLGSDDGEPAVCAGEIVIVDPGEMIIPDYIDYDLKPQEPEEINQDDLKEKKVKIASLSNEILDSISSVNEGDAFLQILRAAKPTMASLRNEPEKTIYVSAVEGGSEVRPLSVKRLLYTATAEDSEEHASPPSESIEAHITLDSDGMTLLSQAANIASSLH